MVERLKIHNNLVSFCQNLPRPIRSAFSAASRPGGRNRCLIFPSSRAEHACAVKTRVARSVLIA